MEIQDFETQSLLYAKLAQKQAELAAYDGRQRIASAENSGFENNLKKYDEQDYQRVVSKFKNTDTMIKAHEQDHASSTTTTTTIQYDYQMGPDGKMYAVGGEVRLDTSMPKDPKQAQLKLDELQKASNVSSGMSVADGSIAIQANLMKQLIQMRMEDAI